MATAQNSMVFVELVFRATACHPSVVGEFVLTMRSMTPPSKAL